ncbi:MAG: two-component system, OmpR family, response regulator [Caballeronia sp.]|nr:two-component system, OmpR family, response regulator [Caballeronia sp.]
MKVLVVEDACETADGLAAVAKSWATLSPSPITRARRSTVRKGSLSTILFDVVSPDGDGIALCQRPRSEGASQDACMIAVTGRADLSADAFALFDGYLHKPIAWPALKHALEVWSVMEPASDDAHAPEAHSSLGAAVPATWGFSG